MMLIVLLRLCHMRWVHDRCRGLLLRESDHTHWRLCVYNWGLWVRWCCKEKMKNNHEYLVRKEIIYHKVVGTKALTPLYKNVRSSMEPTMSCTLIMILVKYLIYAKKHKCYLTNNKWWRRIKRVSVLSKPLLAICTGNS